MSVCVQVLMDMGLGLVWVPVFTFGVDDGVGGAEIVIGDGRGGGAVMGVGSMLVCVQTLVEMSSGSDWVPESSKIWAAVRQCSP